MAEYKGIKGFKVQTVSTDPAASIIATGTWASGGDLNTAKEGHGATGIQTAALSFAGSTPTLTSNNESYNGTSWTELANLNTARYGIASATSGTTTSALGFGGYAPAITAVTESWNGSVWTEVNDLNQARAYFAGVGTQTSALGFGGDTYPAPFVANTETWNGTSWTEVNDLNTARKYNAGTGTSTSALSIAGESPGGIVGNVESWNGTSWTEITDVNTTRAGGAASSGTSTDSLFFGGIDTTPAFTGATESWNGTSWTEVADLSLGRTTLAGNGTSSLALAHGGQSPITAATEEWTTTPAPSFQQENLGQVFYNSTSDAFKVTKQSVPAGTWASGGNLNTGRSNNAGIGNQTAALDCWW
jgi:hypothetical protein